MTNCSKCGIEVLAAEEYMAEMEKLGEIRFDYFGNPTLVFSGPTAPTDTNAEVQLAEVEKKKGFKCDECSTFLCKNCLINEPPELLCPQCRGPIDQFLVETTDTFWEETEEITSVEPTDVDGWIDRGLELCDEEQYSKAEQALKEAQKLGPSNSVVYVNLAHVYAQQQRYEDAAKACREAIRLDKYNVIAWVNLGDALNNQGRHKEASEVFQTALNIAPPDWEHRDHVENLKQTVDATIRAEKEKQIVQQAPPRVERAEKREPTGNAKVKIDYLSKLLFIQENAIAFLKPVKTSEEYLAVCNNIEKTFQKLSVIPDSYIQLVTNLRNSIDSMPNFNELDPEKRESFHQKVLAIFSQEMRKTKKTIDRLGMEHLS